MSDHLPDPSTAPELFEGVLLRRAFAWLIDCVIIGGITVATLLVGLVFGVVTLGLGLLALPIIIPVAILGYYAATLGSPMRATVGMQAMDIVLTPVRGRPLDGWAILVHPLLFWLTVWISWPVSILFALFTPRQQMIHDLIVGTLMLRRSPMQRFWRSSGMPSV
ncbi:MAG: RDD family protein [Devosia sp.]|uniref:RDD family protein n=1 Tax=Devosia sp. TaxID=1871048 RepID=UPI001AC6BBED|nr:RDD family protein [Devosia sp.]MBN9317762.1 RDD family protein [Devosia sp.]